MGFFDDLIKSFTSSDFLAAAVPTAVTAFGAAGQAKANNKLQQQALERQAANDEFNKQMALAGLYLQYQKLAQGGGGGGGGAASKVARDSAKAQIIQQGFENKLAGQNQLLSTLLKEPELAQEAGKLSLQGYGQLLQALQGPALATIR